MFIVSRIYFKKGLKSSHPTYSRDGMYRDLVPLPVHLLDRRVVRVLVRHKERRLYVATVRVLPFTAKHLLVQLDVVVVYGVVERDGDHLRDIFEGEIPRDGGTVFRAETVGKYAHGGIARGRAVWVVVIICNITHSRVGRMSVKISQ